MPQRCRPIGGPPRTHFRTTKPRHAPQSVCCLPFAKVQKVVVSNREPLTEKYCSIFGPFFSRLCGGWLRGGADDNGDAAVERGRRVYGLAVGEAGRGVRGRRGAVRGGVADRLAEVGRAGRAGRGGGASVLDDISRYVAAEETNGISDSHQMNDRRFRTQMPSAYARRGRKTMWLQRRGIPRLRHNHLSPSLRPINTPVPERDWAKHSCGVANAVRRWRRSRTSFVQFCVSRKRSAF